MCSARQIAYDLDVQVDTVTVYVTCLIGEVDRVIDNAGAGEIG